MCCLILSTGDSHYCSLQDQPSSKGPVFPPFPNSSYWHEASGKGVIFFQIDSKLSEYLVKQISRIWVLPESCFQSSFLYVFGKVFCFYRRNSHSGKQKQSFFCVWITQCFVLFLGLLKIELCYLYRCHVLNINLQ